MPRSIVIFTPKPKKLTKKQRLARSPRTRITLFGERAFNHDAGKPARKATKVRVGTPRSILNREESVDSAWWYSTPRLKIDRRLFKWENRQQVPRKTTKVVKASRGGRGFKMPRTLAIGAAHRRAR
jgi:hypothetical protein